MELVRRAAAALRQPPAPDAPTVEVFFGGTADGPDVGLVRVHVPAGSGMPAHRHNGSDVILSPVVGSVRISKGEESIDVHVGDSALIRRDEAVALTNPGDTAAEVIVAAGPADFVTGILAWPEPKRAVSTS